MATLDWLRVTFPDLDNLTPLSQGGQKLVFAARHKTDGEVVLKLIKPNQDLETIRREVLAVATVQSARVPKILEYGGLFQDSWIERHCQAALASRA
jgi:hypothetical protein